ncbi:MAG: response regulator [Elusimicrobia bacterium]|nr:response regulator [Elusimicrobiota bacterium]
MAAARKKILVVDDDEMLRSLAADLLSAEFEVHTAVDGQDGWEKASALRPDLVISDLMMPRMHGYELCGLLKGEGGLPGVKVMVTSSKSFPTDISQATAAGADDYLVKPYMPDELLRRVRALLGLDGEPPKPQPEPARTARRAAPTSAELRVEPASAGRLPVYVRFWGVRGSCPTSNPGVAGYGGNTACVELRVGDTPIIFDCGTGLRELGDSLAREFKGRELQGHIFVGHTHWDHIQGFPFFTPFYNPRNKFMVFSVHGAHGSLGRIFTQSMSLDYFPVPLSSLAAKLGFVEMKGPVDLGAARVSFQHMNHPGVCIGFRVEVQGRAVTYLSDHEPFARLGGTSDLSLRQDAEIAAFARGSDLVIREAQYTEEEYTSRKGWGHSTYDDAARFALESGVKRMAITHHDPYRTDVELDANIEYCRGLIAKGGGSTDCFGAREGMRVDL